MQKYHKHFVYKYAIVNYSAFPLDFPICTFKHIVLRMMTLMQWKTSSSLQKPGTPHMQYCSHCVAASQSNGSVSLLTTGLGVFCCVECGHAVPALSSETQGPLCTYVSSSFAASALKRAYYLS